MQIKDIKQLAGKTALTGPISFTLDEVYERKEGVGQYQKSIQRFKASQGSEFLFGEVENHSDLSGHKGQMVTVVCGQSKTGEATGIYAEPKEFKGQTYINLRLTKSAKITIGGPVSTPTEPRAPSPHPSPKSQPNANVATPAPARVSVKAELNKMANLLLFCYQAMDYVRSEMPESKISDEAYEQKVSCLFIESNKRGLCTHVPTGTISHPNQPRVPQVAPEPEPTVQPEPSGSGVDLDYDMPF